MSLENASRQLLAAILFSAALALGCSSSQQSGRPDIDAMPKEELYGASAKASIYEFRAKVRKRGASAVKQDLQDLVENLEGHERLKLSEHAETYKQIVEKLKALQGSLASASKDAAVKAADEIGALADKLPGKADPNPQVE
jgi:hypothetical protein